MDTGPDPGAAAPRSPADARFAGRGGVGWTAPHAAPEPIGWDALADAVRRVLEGKHAPPFPPAPPAAGERFVFSADDGSNGRELRTTEGTAEGTRLARDINPGAGDAFPFSFSGSFGALGGGRALFLGNDDANGTELWISDGTEAGTRLLKDVRPGTGAGSSSDAGGLAPFADGSRALFTADDGVHGREVWVTDGAEDGTRLVEDVRPGAEGCAPGQFVSLGIGGDGEGGTRWLDPFG